MGLFICTTMKLIDLTNIKPGFPVCSSCFPLRIMSSQHLWVNYSSLAGLDKGKKRINPAVVNRQQNSSTDPQETIKEMHDLPKGYRFFMHSTLGWNISLCCRMPNPSSDTSFQPNDAPICRDCDHPISAPKVLVFYLIQLDPKNQTFHFLLLHGRWILRNYAGHSYPNLISVGC